MLTFLLGDEIGIVVLIVEHPENKQVLPKSVIMTLHHATMVAPYIGLHA